MHDRIAAFTGKRVLVVGDVMLDEFVWGDTYRISPEAPVPVVTVGRRSFVPGGAGNVAANVVSLGGRALLGGVVGSDLAADMLRRSLRESGVAVDGLIADADRPTTSKARILARGQQVVRVDTEERSALGESVESQLTVWAARAVHEADALIVSDYNKGVLSGSAAQRIIAAARDAGLPVVADPKGKSYQRYRGATVVTPNTFETAEAAGMDADDDDELVRAARRLQEVLGGGALLVTRGKVGMTLFEVGADPVHIEATAREVYDVTGAGDTVTSTLALALAAGESLSEAARLANYAAGLVVGKVGTATITQEELMEAAGVPAADRA